MEDFAHNLRVMRAIRGLTQKELAKAASTSDRIIINLEAGRVLPAPDLERRLHRALDWTELEDKALELLTREVIPAGD